MSAPLWDPQLPHHLTPPVLPWEPVKQILLRERRRRAARDEVGVAREAERAGHEEVHRPHPTDGGRSDAQGGRAAVSPSPSGIGAQDSIYRNLIQTPTSKLPLLQGLPLLYIVTQNFFMLEGKNMAKE